MAILSKLQMLLLLLFVAGVAYGVHAQSPLVSGATPEISLSEYISELDRCSQTLARAAADPVTEGVTERAVLRDLRASLPPVWKVRVGSTSYSVDTSWLADDLAAIAINPGAQQQRMAATKQRLAALRESAEALEAETSRDQARQNDAQQNSAQTRAKLDAILRAKEFQGEHGPSWSDVLKARFYAWLGRQLDKLHLPRSAAFGNTIAWVVIALAVGLVALWAVRNLVRGRSPDINLRGAVAPGRDWRYWLREARSAAERRDYRAAIHAAYWAGVARLEEASLLPEDRSRTPRESLRLVRRESPEYTPLAALTRSFELVWYGYRAATETDWNNAMQQLEQLENARIPRPA
jgi:hypothetical protein